MHQKILLPTAKCQLIHKCVVPFMLASQVIIASIYANGWKILKIIDTSRWVLLPIVWLNYHMKGKNVVWKMASKHLQLFLVVPLADWMHWLLRTIFCPSPEMGWSNLQIPCRIPKLIHAILGLWNDILNLMCFTVFKGTIYKFGASTTPSSWEPIVWIIISEKSCTAGEYPYWYFSIESKYTLLTPWCGVKMQF